MAKTAKLKKSAKSTSIHSRAAKRASSPSLNLDKSLTSVKAPESSIHRSSVLSVHNGAGITKRKGKARPLSRHQRRRQENRSDRAEAVMDKTEKKVEKSLVKSKVVKERSSAWEELNGNVKSKKTKSEPKTDLVDDKDEWEDEEMDEDVAVPSTQPTVAPVPKPVEAVDSGLATAVPPEQVEDEIL